MKIRSVSRFTSRRRARLGGIGQEGALEAVDDEPLDLVGAEAERARGELDLVRHRGVRHEPVVGVHGDAQALAEVDAERMLLDVLHRAGLQVRGQAHLERDAVVVDVLHQVPVLEQQRAVPDAVRPAVVERLRDRGRAERLAGVHGRVDVVLEDQLERRAVRLGRVVLLLPRQVEGQHALALVGHRQLGQRQRELRVHRADAADDHAGGHAELAARVVQAGDDRVHDVLERRASACGAGSASSAPRGGRRSPRRRPRPARRRPGRAPPSPASRPA